MAEKILKGIIFPGLEDTYIVPEVDDTLSVPGASADAKVVGEALSGKQPIGNYVKSINGNTPDENGNIEITVDAGEASEQVQSDWNVTDETDPAYIKNKPEIVPRAYIDDAISAMSRIVATDDGDGHITLVVSRSIHYVTFRNGVTGEEYKMPVADGDDCGDVVLRGLWPEPVKPSDEYYDHIYAGWGATDGGEVDPDILKNITGDKIVYAIFKAEPKLYTIVWLDDDGTELKSEDLAYNTVPSYTPTKPGYTFDKWTPTPVAVTGDASYTASWKEASNVILPETTITTAASAYASPFVSVTNTSGIAPALGESVKVTWNGVSTTLTNRTVYFILSGGNSTSTNGFGNPHAITKSIANVEEYRWDSDTGPIAEDSGLEYFITVGKSNISISTANPITATVTIEPV